MSTSGCSPAVRRPKGHRRAEPAGRRAADRPPSPVRQSRSAVSDGLLGGFHDHRIARSEGRADFPGQHQQRESSTATRQPTTPTGSRTIIAIGIVAAGARLVVDLVDGLGVPFDRVDGLGNVDRLAVADRFAAVEALHHRQFAPVAGDQLAQADQHVLAPGRMQPRPVPLLERLAGLLYGEVNVRGIACRDGAERLAGGRD